MKQLLLTAVILLSAAAVRAEIIWTFDPWGNNTWFGLHSFDINNDGTADLTFVPGGLTTVVYCEGNNRVYGSGETVSPFSSGGNPGTYTGIADNASGFYLSNFNGMGPKYMLFKIKVGANWYYGWLQIETYSNHYVIYQWAYENTPNTPVPAGYTSSAGIEESAFEENITVFPNPASEEMTVQMPEGCSAADVILYSATGEEIARATSGTALSVADIPAGVYLVAILHEEKIYRKRLVKQ